MCDLDLLGNIFSYYQGIHGPGPGAPWSVVTVCRVKTVTRQNLDLVIKTIITFKKGWLRFLAPTEIRVDLKHSSS